MFNPHSQNQNPDLEQAHKELADVEGRIASAQTILADIIANTKRVEGEGSKKLDELHEEITVKQAELKGVQDAHRAVISGHDIEKNTAKSAAAIAIQEKEATDKALDESIRLYTEQKETHKKHMVEVDALKKQESDIRSSISELTRAESELKKNIAAANVEFTPLVHKKEIAKNTLEELSLRTEVLKKEHASLDTSKEDKQNELMTLRQSVEQETTKLADLKSEVADFEKQKAEHVAHIVEQNRQANERLGAATRLEQHIEGKRQELKKIEEKFTTEHLARMGYSKI